MTRDLHDPAPAIASTPRFYSETLDWLAGYHAEYGEKSTRDLVADERPNAIWRLRARDFVCEGVGGVL
jgi:hypothetical protein